MGRTDLLDRALKNGKVANELGQGLFEAHQTMTRELWELVERASERGEAETVDEIAAILAQDSSRLSEVSRRYEAARG